MSLMQSVQDDCSPEVLNDVVLDERVASPAVDGKVGVAVGVVGARVGNGADMISKCFSSILYFKELTYRADPGFHPLPPTKLPPLPQLTL